MFAKNEVLEEIVHSLFNARLDYESLVAQLKKRKFKVKGKYDKKGWLVSGFFYDTPLLPTCAEIVFSMALRAVSEKKGYNDKIVFSPINGVAESENYFFISEGSNVLVYDKDTFKPYTEIDQLIVVDRLPVIVEIKYGAIKRDDTLHLPEKRLIPVKEFFGSDGCGYLIFGAKDAKKKGMESFKEVNGLFVHFFDGNFDARITQIAYENNLLPPIHLK